MIYIESQKTDDGHHQKNNVLCFQGIFNFETEQGMKIASIIPENHQKEKEDEGKADG